MNVFGQPVEADFMADNIQRIRTPIVSQFIPDFFSELHGAGGRINAQQVHPVKDKRININRQFE